MTQRGRGKKAKAKRIKVKKVRADRFIIRAMQSATRRRN